MKYLNNKILESILRGINLAIDDIDDVSIEYQKKSKIENNIRIRDLLWYVDLELPSGTLWAKYNLGVDPKKLNTPEDWYGDYYSWGEIKPKNSYMERYYKFKMSDSYESSKYNKTDKLIFLQPEDNAAIQNDKLGYGWTMPTRRLCAELIANTDYRFEHNYNGIEGLNGILLRSRKNHNKTLFIPAAGTKYRKSTPPYESGNYTGLWSMESEPIFGAGAFAIFFNIKENAFDCHSCYKYAGINIRPVMKNKI